MLASHPAAAVADLRLCCLFALALPLCVTITLITIENCFIHFPPGMLLLLAALCVYLWNNGEFYESKSNRNHWSTCFFSACREAALPLDSVVSKFHVTSSPNANDFLTAQSETVGQRSHCVTMTSARPAVPVLAL